MAYEYYLSAPFLSVKQKEENKSTYLCMCELASRSDYDFYMTLWYDLFGHSARSQSTRNPVVRWVLLFTNICTQIYNMCTWIFFLKRLEYIHWWFVYKRANLLIFASGSISYFMYSGAKLLDENLF